MTSLLRSSVCLRETILPVHCHGRYVVSCTGRIDFSIVRTDVSTETPREVVRAWSVPKDSEVKTPSGNILVLALTVGYIGT